MKNQALFDRWAGGSTEEDIFAAGFEALAEQVRFLYRRGWKEDGRPANVALRLWDHVCDVVEDQP